MKAQRVLLFTAILLLIFPGYAAPQNENLAQQATVSEGTDQPIDAETFYLLLESAEKGSPSAQFRLGMIYLQGNGVAQDLSEAEKWLREAAEQGNPPAQSMLGAMYATGLGVTKDYIKAYMWLTLSIDETNEKQAPFLHQATELRNTIVKEMTPQQIEEARELAGKWNSVDMKTPKEIPGNVLNSMLIKKVAPDYPREAMRNRIQGTVILKVTVDRGGNVDNIEVLEGNPLLNGAAAAAVKQWKYSPTLLDGIPIPVIATVRVNFRLGR